MTHSIASPKTTKQQADSDVMLPQPLYEIQAALNIIVACYSANGNSITQGAWNIIDANGDQIAQFRNLIQTIAQQMDP